VKHAYLAVRATASVTIAPAAGGRGVGVARHGAEALCCWDGGGLGASDWRDQTRSMVLIWISLSHVPVITKPTTTWTSRHLSYFSGHFWTSCNSRATIHVIY